MIRTRIIALLCALLLPAALLAATKTAAPKASGTTAAPPGGSSNDILPFKVAEKTLPNGLKVIVVPTGFPNIVSLQIPVSTGSRNEVEPGKSGFAHFFEHMMFRGTKAYPTEKYTAIITKAGARQNAFTTDDFTNFHTTFAKEDLAEVLKIEADRFQHLSYSPEDFKTEARAVLGEYNKNSASPIRKLLEVQHDAAYTTHTYKHTTMGFIKDIEDMPNQYDYSKTFFSRWYRPENATIIVAGDVNPDEVFKLVEKDWGSWKRGTDKPVAIPQEPPAKGPFYAHVDWTTPTLPWVTVAFHGPAFSDKVKDFAAMDTMLELYFGQTSDLHKRLVEDEQKVDQLFVFNGANVDPSLVTILARVKKPADAIDVRDQIMRTFQWLRTNDVPAGRLNDAKASARYSFIRDLDNTEAIAGTVAQFAHFNHQFNTVNNYYRVLETVGPADLRASAEKYFTDNSLVVTTLSKDPLPGGIDKLPALASLAGGTAASAGAATGDMRVIAQKSVLPELEFKILFPIGSANDPQGKEGLARLAAAMIADAGSKQMRIDEINKALYPLAGGFFPQTDKDMTALTGRIHRDNWRRFLDIVVPQLLEPGFRDEDFRRLKDAQINALKQDLRSNNEEELGKERLQTNVFAGTPYGHPVLGTVAGIESIVLDDVKNFIAQNYTRANLVLGVSGDYPEEFLGALKNDLARLPAGSGAAATLGTLPKVVGHQPSGVEVEIVQKETRATAISFGFPLPITRTDEPDFAALNLARAWLGEHRSSSGRLYNRIREIRGMNYGDYAYIEFFNRPGGQFFPSPNIARRTQLFEVWIRPVVPVNGHMALRIAVYELQKLINDGLSQKDFDDTRDYLMKNVYLMTATQNQRLGYALDSWWYGVPEYTKHMRDQYAKLKRDDVNRTIKKYLSAQNLSIVIVAKDAQGLKDALVSDVFSPIKYDAAKPADLLEEDKAIGALKLNIKPENVKITPVDEVWAK